MTFKWFVTGLAATLVPMLLVGVATAQVISLENFEGPLPGEQPYPGGYNFFGGGAIDPDPNLISTDYFTEEILEFGGVGGSQGFQFSFDGSVNAGSYTYGGFGGFLGFFGEGFGAAAGAIGANNPSRYVLSFDLHVEGNDGDTAASMPVGGGVSLFKADYEAVYGDLDGDPNVDTGYDIWNSTFLAEVTDPNGFTHISWNLGESLSPPTLDSGNPILDPNAPRQGPFFNDGSTFAFQLNFNSGGFGNDPNNAIIIDNLQLEFIPADPGDFNGDGNIDGLDFLAWQQDPSLGPLSDWENNYPSSLTATVQNVPEPSAGLLGLLAALLLTKPVRR